MAGHIATRKSTQTSASTSRRTRTHSPIVNGSQKRVSVYSKPVTYGTMSKQTQAEPCVLYIRVSTTRQANQGVSLKAQIARGKLHAQYQNFLLPNSHIFIDSGVSAKTPLWSRPAGKQMKEFIAKHLLFAMRSFCQEIQVLSPISSNTFAIQLSFGDYMKPVFFVALAHTDTVAYFNSDTPPTRTRISNLNLFPNSLKENLLFSMSFDSKIHYESWSSNLDSIANGEELYKENALPKRMFADCGAFQFRELPRPLLGDVELDFNVAWDYYERKHVKAKHRWDEILLCSPDHIITPGMSDEDATSRFEFIKENAAPFLEKSKSDSRVFAVGVIHGRTIDERKQQYEMFKSLGYEYVALGGMVPYSTKQNQVLDIVAGIKDISNPIIESDSILGKCRKDGIKLHVFGLNSPEWVRWWHRLQLDSFDGSKLSTEGAANGWYYIPNDGKGAGREIPNEPKKVGELYQRIAVKKMGSDKWKWKNENGLLKPNVPLTEKSVDTNCNCPACQYVKSSRCTSERCWFRKENLEHHHVADPRMMGSTEHNMGRVAHNAFVFSWIIEQLERLNKLADESEITEQNAWLLNWKTIEVKH